MVTDVRRTVLTALAEVAPETEGEVIEPDADLLDVHDLDSMDLLNLVASIEDQLGVRIPERDWPNLRTLASAVEHLEGLLQPRTG